MDAFFVSVELLRRPDLVGQPVVVGGTGRRGVIAAASYEARGYGVYSAMPSTTARRLCPHAVFLPGDYALYSSVSATVNEIFHSFTPIVEPLSLDEAFLDVTGASRLLGTGMQIAQGVRRAVHDQLGLWCSVGVAPNKFLAKLGSVAAKPKASRDGVRAGREVVEIEPGHELEFLHPLPVQALWGVGPATLERLQRLGVKTVADLAQIPEASLVAAVGKASGQHLHRLSWALDDREVEVDRALKSIGHEETFATDKHTHDELARELVRLADGVASRMRGQGVGARTFTLKVRFTDFETISRSTTVKAPVATARAIVQAVQGLLQTVDPSAGVRLLGVSASNFGEPAQQLSFDEIDDTARDDHEWQRAERTIDDIRSKFGASAIGPASAVSSDGLRLVRRGAQQWGPDHDQT